MASVSQQKRMQMINALWLVRRRRQRIQTTILLLLIARQIGLVRIMFILQLLLSALQSAVTTLPTVHRQSCRRVPRNTGWWDITWSSYSEKRFKRTFRIARTTFRFIHEKIKNDITKEHITEEPISTEQRLAICLYRLSRGDYYHIIAEMTGIGESTVCNIVREVAKAIVENLWAEFVESNFPYDRDLLYQKVKEMEQEWQFPYAYAAIDGCHIPIKCPPGGQESARVS